jgi:hypothetical protein
MTTSILERHEWFTLTGLIFRFMADFDPSQCGSSSWAEAPQSRVGRSTSKNIESSDEEGLVDEVDFLSECEQSDTDTDSCSAESDPTIARKSARIASQSGDDVPGPVRCLRSERLHSGT